MYTLLIRTHGSQGDYLQMYFDGRSRQRKIAYFDTIEAATLVAKIINYNSTSSAHNGVGIADGMGVPIVGVSFES